MTDQIQLNLVGSRKLKCGNWILITSENKPIVVNEKVKSELVSGKMDIQNYDDNFLDVLKENGFIRETENLQYPLVEKQSHHWVVWRKLLLISGGISFFMVLMISFLHGVPTGNHLIEKQVGIVKNISFIIIFSIITTLTHELMHVIFGQNWNLRELIISVKRSVVKVPLSQIWIWSLLGRISTVSAGVILDECLLAVLMLSQYFYKNWMLSVSCSVLMLRILWQLRFHRRCDGQLFFSMLLDDPFLNEEITQKENKPSYVILFNIVGRIVSAVILLGWIIPAIISFYKTIH